MTRKGTAGGSTIEISRLRSVYRSNATNLAAENNVAEHAQSPNVCLLAAVPLATQYFRRREAKRRRCKVSTEGRLIFCRMQHSLKCPREGIKVRLPLPNVGGRPKVDELNTALSIKDDVLVLDVSVHDAVAM